jgi:glycosyltransferase involved in cell wall biosynthesis
MAPGLMTRAGQPTRLLMLSHYFEERRGGIEIVAAALARELAALGFAPVWLATGDCGPDGEHVGCRRLSLAASDIAERRLKIPYPILMPSAWRAIFRETARSDVVLVHDALYLTSIAAYLAARAHRKPLVVVQHVGFVPFRSSFLRGLMKLANLWIAAPLLRGASQAIFISQLTMQHFAHLRWRRTPALVFNGVDTGTFSPSNGVAETQSARRALGLPVEVPIALFVGRFVEKKGLQVLERMARIRGEVVFAFAGQGALDPVRWGLSNVRVFSGLSGSTLASLYRASDVLLLPSAGEGFPLVVQEALACGLPVICGTDTARADSQAAAFLKGVDVDLASPGRTAEAFSEELTRVLARGHSEADRRERSAFVNARYSWQRSALSYATILRGATLTSPA